MVYLPKDSFCLARFRYNSKTRPPPQITVHILESDYEYITQVKEFSNQPFYDILHKELVKYEKITLDHGQNLAFLELLKQENQELKKKLGEQDTMVDLPESTLVI